MSVSNSVINALRSAVETNPEDMDVRLHLADLLNQAELFQEALEHFSVVLSRDPANLKALQGAGQAARATGDDARATGYETLLNALGGKSNPPATDQSAAPTHNSNVVSIGSENKAHKPDSKAKLRVVDNDDNVTVGPWDDPEPRITLDDVGGMEQVKKRLQMSFLTPLKNPDVVKLYGKSLRGGLMLYGPPGCGKTFIARALAGELGARFMNIGMSDVLDMWLGESERKLHEIFETARRNAPAVLFFDEIDALGQKRSNLRHSAGRNIVNQLLAELDSVGSDNKNVFVLAATNHPWDVDTALRRPGRFDRVVLVLPPDAEARAAILKLHMQDRPMQDVDLEQIARQTDFYSGADLAHVVETAVEHAMHQALETGDMRPIQQRDFEAAISEVRPSTRPWFDTARNYAMFANEGGVYDELLNYIQARKL